MESYGRCLFLSGFFHSGWFMLLCVSVVHSFVLLSSIPSSLPFSLCWFYSFSAACLAYVEGSLACGTPNVYLLRLVVWFSSGPSSEISEKGSDWSILGQMLTSEPKDCGWRGRDTWRTRQSYENLLNVFDSSLQPTWEHPSDLPPYPTFQILTEIVKCIPLGSIPNELNKKGKN